MNKHFWILKALRECTVVLAVAVGLFCLSTENFWGILLGLTLILAAFLFSTALRIDRGELEQGRGF
jgi:hypothetical protein